ncbi:MAG: WYL domain-containing protein [Olegusella sp.]|nr:WYL domain-containing protein [Olegusella sp.]
MMDGFYEAERVDSPDDELARRLTSLFIAFSNARAPLGAAEIRTEYYPGLSEDSFARQFRRDRERLVLCGMNVYEADGGWAADRASFADPPDIGADELAALDIACLQLAEDPSFPYRGDLRIALAKIDDGYEGFPHMATPKAGAQSRQVLALLRAFDARRPVKTAYTNAKGVASERTIAVWGSFNLRDHTYFVAPEVDETGTRTGEPRTWRDDRFGKVKELTGVTYRIPEDFFAEDFRKLPFQIGTDAFEAVFRVPATASEEAVAATGAYGEVGTDGHGHRVWKVEANDCGAAARWAIAGGLVPTGPRRLVDEWRRILSEANDHAGK